MTANIMTTAALGLEHVVFGTLLYWAAAMLVYRFRSKRRHAAEPPVLEYVAGSVFRITAEERVPWVRVAVIVLAPPLLLALLVWLGRTA